ncbi:amidase [Sneathiella limimaris]|uniref:amidase n=1 Tax=Sneathiella limimaris TaxID=1964213 RepID=UPI001469EF63|nr:amidase [Sneathiella limimaris]
MSDLAFITAVELVELYKSKEVSPVEATKAALDQIEKVNPALNAFVRTDPDGALEAATASEARWHKGEPLGLVDGVPTTIKDVMLMKGMPTLKGSKLVDPEGDWSEDSPATQRLRESGAVFLGKTTTPEFGWKGVTDSPLSGITRNPWNPEKTPGGSSGGASAACAAGMGVLHTGTDGGGSVRIPAAFAGIFGHKPSFGRVPAWPASAYGTVSHVGPMTRSVADACLMLDVMKGHDSRDWYALPETDIQYRNLKPMTFAGRKIAYSRDLGYAKVDPEVAKAVDRAVDCFRSLGAEIVEVDPGFECPLEIFSALWQSGAWYALKPADEKARKLMDPGLQLVFEKGSKVTTTDLFDANIARAELGALMKRFHETYDLLLTPSLAVTAFEVGKLGPTVGDKEVSDWVDWTPFSYPFNLTQQPACSIPCGLANNGLPVGLQIVGPMHKDEMVLSAALAFEANFEGAKLRPKLNELG